MIKYFRLILVAMVLLETSCSIEYSPNCYKLNRKSVPPDIQQVEIARRAWNILSNPARKAEWPKATKAYNDSLLIMIQRMRCDWYRDGGDVRSDDNDPYVIIRPDAAGGRWSRLYEDAIPCSQVDTSLFLEERVYANGLGIPMAGIVKTDPAAVKNNVIKDNGNIHTITAILDFDHMVNGKPSMKVFPRLKNETVMVGGVRQPLAGDFTVPIYMFWKKTHIEKSSLLGLFNPRKAIDYKGLYFSEPYDPNKIPVVFTHGLMSSPATFYNLVNRLQRDPVIRKNYQFWFFSYPSGLPWVLPAKDLRDALKAVEDEYDPKDTSPNFNRMVMVGHSMGGLITRLNNAEKPWSVIPYMIKDSDGIKDLGYKQALQYRLPEELPSDKVSELLIFEPSPRVKRVVFMATPHRGSDFADRWFGQLGQRLITIPRTLMVEITRIGTLSSNMILFNPNRLVQEFTSIGQLSPSSPPIRGVQHLSLKPGIHVHSIIGDRGMNDTPDSSDGVVDYDSSHLGLADSEVIVPSGHSVQACIPAAHEMNRILKEHLKSEGISPEMPKDEVVAPTIWQENPIQYHFKTLYH